MISVGTLIDDRIGRTSISVAIFASRAAAAGLAPRRKRAAYQRLKSSSLARDGASSRKSSSQYSLVPQRASTSSLCRLASRESEPQRSAPSQFQVRYDPYMQRAGAPSG